MRVVVAKFSGGIDVGQVTTNTVDSPSSLAR
jgi:hypothetical protein